MSNFVTITPKPKAATPQGDVNLKDKLWNQGLQIKYLEGILKDLAFETNRLRSRSMICSELYSKIREAALEYNHKYNQKLSL